MFPPLVRRFVAALLAFWLPLQLGTAFAVAAPMQVAGAAGIETVGHAGHHRSASVTVDAGSHVARDHHASRDHSRDHVSRDPTSHDPTSHDRASHDDCHEATAATPGAGSGCASTMGLDASCVKCAFCFASAVALAVAVPKAFDLVARSAPILVVIAALDSRALIPPDPPPIA